MEIDKNFNQLSEEYSKQIVESFNQYITKLCSINNLDDISLISSVTQRNTYTSKLFPYIEKIYILHKLGLTSEASNKHLYKNETTLLKRVRFYFFTLFWVIVKNFLPKQKSKEQYDNELFLEIFENDDISKELGSHYYPNLIESLPLKQKKICFLINTLNINSLAGIIRLRKKLKRCHVDYILYDAELTLSDVHKYFKDCELTLNNFTNVPDFLGVDMKIILKKILKTEKYSRTNLFAYFKYRKFLSDNKYHKKSSLLLWNENHSFDRALCLANKRRRTKLNLVGHAGYIDSKEKNCLTVTEIEKNNQSVPKKVFTLCKKNNDYESGHAPAFRYHSFFVKNKLKDAKENISIAFPLPKDDGSINRLLVLAQKLIQSGHKLNYRFHPIQAPVHKELIERTLKQPPSNEIISDFMKKSKILISSGLSGIYLDAFFCQTPSINLTSNMNIDNDIFANPGDFTNEDFREFTQFYHISNDYEVIKKLVDNPPIITINDINYLRNAFIKPSPSNIMKFFEDIKKT